QESKPLLSCIMKVLCPDSYGMTNVVDRLGEWLILCLEKVSGYAPTYKHPPCHSIGISIILFKY
ncbi:hypothetical protein LXM63_18840, partial [Chryseobacterium gleum]|uniref:hypothetical protein n=1 Tax=Chryseobacterium gleum TaxID=250 RepID=UPI001E29D2B3